MFLYTFGLAVVCGLMAPLPWTVAGFHATPATNIAVYWGQNSVNRAGAQQRLATYCSNTPVNIIPLAFLTGIKNPTSVNFANAGDNCTTFPGTQLLRCPEIEEDILACQSLGKTILLSIGGATYTEGGFSSASEAASWADTLWAMFGPDTSGGNNNNNSSSSAVHRPFGSASVDGFDMDLESPVTHMAPFAARLRQLMDAAAGAGRRFLLSAAPQCPFPDQAMNDMLQAVAFDFVSVQFYNNYCGAGSYAPGPGNKLNFQTWDDWVSTSSVNKGLKVLVGVPGSSTAAGTGYVSGEQLAGVIEYSRRFASFGGVMIWDMSQVYGNPGFLDSVVSALGAQLPAPGPAPTSTSTAPTAATTFVTVRRPAATATA